jgi:ABC-type branched-subunit amino acid transport system substrate-binding protein
VIVVKRERQRKKHFYLHGGLGGTHHNPLQALTFFELLPLYGEKGASVDAFAALSYDAVMLLADAIRRAGSDDPRSILTALQKTENFCGITGTISYENGSRILEKGVTIVSIVNRSFTFAGTVVPKGIPSP